MALETGTFISDLVSTNPTSTDPKAEGDDHIRLLKSTIKATFPNVSGAVTPTHTELNYVDGVTSAIQTQLDSKAPLASPTFTGTVTIPSGASIAGFAPLNSPALTGTPTAPTAAPGTATTQIATTEFVVSQAFSSALPGQTGNAGKYLSTDGTAASWQTVNAVSSVGVSVPGFLTVSNSPITSSGTIAITYSGTALPVLNGGTGVTTSTGSGANVLNTSPSITTAVLTGLRETRVAIPASDIDLATGNYFTRTISGTTTLTVSNVPASGTTASFILELTNGGSATVNWFSGVKWAGGTAPTLTASGVDIIGFYTHDGGTNWRGMLLAKDSK